MTGYNDLLLLTKNKASEILKEVSESMPITIPIPINRVVEMYVGDVKICSAFFRKKLEGVSAFATKDMETGWVIVTDASESRHRRRFSIAHELGHIVLFPEMYPAFHDQRKSTQEERICNRFAGDILMPDDAVKLYYQEHPMPFVESVAEYFDVSPQAASIQLKRLGLPVRRCVAGGTRR